MKKLVLFGAGKIGRSFIGQLFATSGYEVAFVDICEDVIDELNRQNEYKVVIKSSQPDMIINVTNVRGIFGSDLEKIADELSTCDIAAISVGQQGLPQVVNTLARGLILRQKKYGRKPLDIILAENMHNADKYVRDILNSILGSDYPIDELVGLVETSIGKMVPIMPREEQEKDRLLVYAEPYNTLILDKKAFRNPIPNVKGLAPKENMKAWVDRKSHIHNFGHAAAAYAGFISDPSARYLADALKIPSVKKFTRFAMRQSADILMKKYPGEFTVSDLEEHIDDLLGRFENKALGDTVFRVGCDLQRKLHRDDRILSPLIDGMQSGAKIDQIVKTFVYGLHFGAKDENGNLLPGDEKFSQILCDKGLLYVLLNICDLSQTNESQIISQIISVYDLIRKQKKII
jgi:mannitol-1-phosphate 5-dehydrogenase